MRKRSGKVLPSGQKTQMSDVPRVPSHPPPNPLLPEADIPRTGARSCAVPACFQKIRQINYGAMRVLQVYI